MNDEVRVGPPDLEDPDWTSTWFQPDGSMSFGQEAHGHAGILTIHGMMDIMRHLSQEASEEVREWMEGGERPEVMPEWLRAVLPPPVPAPVYVTADIHPARSFHTATFAIPVAGAGAQGGATLVSARGDRLRIVVTNTGANPAFVSYTDDADNIITAGDNAWMSLPNGAGVGNPREVRAGGKVYVYSVLGTTVDIQEEYGFVRQRGGFLSP